MRQLRPCEIPGCRTLTLRERCQFHRGGPDARLSSAERMTRQREDREREDDPLFPREREGEA
jgi:hypothetical protein